MERGSLSSRSQVDFVAASTNRRQGAMLPDFQDCAIKDHRDSSWFSLSISLFLFLHPFGLSHHVVKNPRPHGVAPTSSPGKGPSQPANAQVNEPSDASAIELLESSSWVPTHLRAENSHPLQIQPSALPEFLALRKSERNKSSIFYEVWGNLLWGPDNSTDF